MEEKFDTLVQLIDFLARNPQRVDEFKPLLNEFLAADSRTAPKPDEVEVRPSYYRYVPVPRTLVSIDIDPEKHLIQTQGDYHYWFHASLEEDVRGTASTGMRISTYDSKYLEISMLDYSIVHVMVIPPESYFINEKGDQVVLNGAVTIGQKDENLHTGKIFGYLSSDGDYDISVQFVP